MTNDNWFLNALWCVLILIFTFIIGAVIHTNNKNSRPKTQLEIQVETAREDSEILKARNMIAYHERLMEKVSLKLDECNAQFKTGSEMNICKAGVYDAFGLEYDQNVELYNQDKRKYADYREIAFKPLSTEK